MRTTDQRMRPAAYITIHDAALAVGRRSTLASSIQRSASVISVRTPIILLWLSPSLTVSSSLQLLPRLSWCAQDVSRMPEKGCERAATIADSFKFSGLGVAAASHVLVRPRSSSRYYPLYADNRFSISFVTSLPRFPCSHHSLRPWCCGEANSYSTSKLTLT